MKKEKYLLSLVFKTEGDKLGNDALPPHSTLAFWYQKINRESELLDELSKIDLSLETMKIQIKKEDFFETPKGKKKVLLLKKSEAMKKLQKKIFKTVKKFSEIKENEKFFGKNWNPHISFYPDGMEENKFVFVDEIKLFKKNTILNTWMEIKTF